jgi:hypothetical protein
MLGEKGVAGLIEDVRKAPEVFGGVGVVVAH